MTGTFRVIDTAIVTRVVEPADPSARPYTEEVVAVTFEQVDERGVSLFSRGTLTVDVPFDGVPFVLGERVTLTIGLRSLRRAVTRGDVVVPFTASPLPDGIDELDRALLGH